MATRRAVLVILVSLAGLLSALVPAIAQAHGVSSHEAEDSSPHPASAESRLGSFTSQATARDAAIAAAAVTGPVQDVGQWGPVVDWPVVGVHVALLPNGKVLAYDSVGDTRDGDLSESTTTPARRSGTRRRGRRRRST